MPSSFPWIDVTGRLEKADVRNMATISPAVSQLDERALVAYVGHATSDLLEDRRAPMKQNPQNLLDKWRNRASFTPQLLTNADRDFERQQLEVAAEWLKLALARIDQARERGRSIRELRHEVGELQRRLEQGQAPIKTRPHVRLGWLLSPVARKALSEPIRRFLRPIVRRLR